MSISKVVRNSISNASGSIMQGVVNVIPRMTVKSERANKTITWIGEKLSSPQNRLILGVSALMSQPFIDLNNKKGLLLKLLREHLPVWLYDQDVSMLLMHLLRCHMKLLLT